MPGFLSFTTANLLKTRVCWELIVFSNHHHILLSSAPSVFQHRCHHSTVTALEKSQVIETIDFSFHQSLSESSGLISFRSDWFHADQRTWNPPAPQLEVSVLCFFQPVPKMAKSSQWPRAISIPKAKKFYYQKWTEYPDTSGGYKESLNTGYITYHRAVTLKIQQISDLISPLLVKGGSVNSDWLSLRKRLEQGWQGFTVNLASSGVSRDFRALSRNMQNRMTLILHSRYQDRDRPNHGSGQLYIVSARDRWQELAWDLSTAGFAV